MGSLLGGLSGLFGGGMTTIVFIGMLVALLFKPERIVKPESFRLVLYLIIASMVLPALMGLFTDATSIGNGGGFFVTLMLLISTVCSVGAVYFLVDSLSSASVRRE